MRLNYAKEKLGSAVRSISNDRGNIKTRIWNAYLIFHTLSENDFSEELKEDWNFIYNNLTIEEPTHNEKGEVTDGKVQNTLKLLSEDKCVEIVNRIVELEAKLRYK